MAARAKRAKRRKTARDGANQASAAPNPEPETAPPAPSGGFDPARTNAAIAMVQEGVARHQAGDMVAAEQLYRKALETDPENPHALHFLGVVHHQRGENEQAVELIRRSIARNPGFPDAHSNLGAALFALGRLPEAGEHFRRAAELKPSMAEAHSNLAAVLKEQGRVQEALDCFRVAHQVEPATPKFIKRLADLYLEHEQFTEAVDWFGRYLALQPADAEALNNLGYAYERLVNLEQAEACYRRAVERVPDSPEINNNLAGILRRLGRLEEANAYFEHAIGLGPDKWDDQANLARTYTNRGQFDIALPVFERLLEAAPDDPDLMHDYGVCLTLSGRLDDAKDVFERVIALKPDMAEAYNSLGLNRFEAHDRRAAIAAYKKALEFKPQFADCLNNLCFPLLLERRYDEAYMYAKAATVLDDYHPTKLTNPIKVFNVLCDQDAIEDADALFANIDSLHPSTISKCALSLLLYADDDDKTAKVVGAHRRWGENFSNQCARDPLPPLGERKPGDRIRIGFLSSDLRVHSVGRFVAPLFESFDRDRFEIYCYSPWEDARDSVQLRFKEQVTGFRVLADPSHREMAKLIREDGIDILFDLNGFTLHNRTGALAYRAAPVQVFWLGYPFTIGLPEIDYILLDGLCAPVNENWLCEKPLLMPQSWVSFAELDPVPIDPELPFERNGAITFGTMNNPNKFNRPTIARWAEVLARVPDSRFLVVRPECLSRSLCTNLTEEFRRNGIGPERIYFVDNQAQALNHLLYYDEMDITLDTYPVTGGTTTCDALWMGAPVVSLVGRGLHQRLSYSLLTNAGLDDLCAFTPEEFVDKSVALAADRDRLRTLRHGLRDALKDTPLCRTDRFVEDFQTLMMELAERHGLR